jgi:hypothetical protein
MNHYKKQIWQHIKANSGYFFDPSAMRFFGSRILYGTLNPIAGDNYVFITSEQRGTDEPRRYTLREWMNGSVETLGGFHAYATRGEAIKALREALRDEEAVSGHKQERWI